MYEEIYEELKKDGYTNEEIEELLSYDISNYIKDEVYNEKSRLIDFMDATKYLVFSYLLNKISQNEFEDRLDIEYKKFNNKISKSNQKGIRSVEYLVKIENDTNYTGNDKRPVKIDLKGILEEFELDTKSTKNENDRYIRIIKDFYKRTSKTLKKEYVKEKEYLSSKVSKFDKVEKTVLYRYKNGTKFAYFDIASYDSMVYNTNLTRTGVQETIKSAYELGEDILYVDPHPFSCPLCQEYQGRFYSLTGNTKYYKGYYLDNIESTYYWNGGGLLHPNCTHIPRLAYDEDYESNEYSSIEWEERYDAKQKKQSLELARKRLKNDNKIYKELDNQEAIDKNNIKIRKLNKEIKEQKNLMNG
jgi:hypothetical protein